MRLRARKNIKDYKNKDAYIDAVYRKNKELIDSKIPNGGFNKSSKIRFRRIVKERMSQGLTVKQALDVVAKSRTFTTKEEHYSQNVFKRLNKDSQAFKTFRKKLGWRKKIDKTGFKYEGTDGKYTTYSYGNIKIKIKNSPEDDIEGITVEESEE